MPPSQEFFTCIALWRSTVDDIEGKVIEIYRVLAQRFSFFEIIIIDSRPHSKTHSDSIDRLFTQLPGLRYLRFSKDFGPQAQIAAGFDHAIGSTICCLEIGRDRAGILPALISRQIAGTQQLILGRIDRRHLKIWERILRVGFYAFCRKFLAIPMPEYTTSLMLLERQSLNQLNALKESSQQFKGYSFLAGIPIVYFDYEPQAYRRSANLLQQISLSLNFVFYHSSRPLRFASCLALGLGVFNLGYVGYVMAVAIIKKQVTAGWITLSTQNALNFFVLSLLAAVAVEYLWRLVEEVRPRPQYFVVKDQRSIQALENRVNLRNVVAANNEREIDAA